MKKRILALLMAATLTMAMPITAFATETETPQTPAVAVVNDEFTNGIEYTIVNQAPRGVDKSNATYDLTINNVAAGHTYKLYKIFDMSVYESRKEATVDSWGNGITSEGQNHFYSEDRKTAYDVAAFWGINENLSAQSVHNLINELAAYKGTAIESLSGLAAGYYLVEDYDTNTEKSVYSLQLILSQKSVEAKNDTTTLTKKVDDKNDSRPTVEEYNKLLADSADHEIGDNVHYTLTTTIPTYSTNKAPEVFTIFDEMDKSLDFLEDSLVVMIGDEKVNINLENITYAQTETKNKFELNLLEYVTKENAGKTVTVEFDAKLNETAVIGNPGNVNEAYLAYNNENGVRVETPKDKVIVFTYTVLVNKVNEKNEPLAGAEFTLYKAYDKDATNVPAIDGIEPEENDGKTYYPVARLEAVKAGENYTAAFKGVDDGLYMLVESVTPEGYNTMKPVYFEINATHTQDAEESPLSLTELTGVGDITFTPSLSEGTLSADIVNNQGTLLPSTGGIGTTIFYIIGGMLVVGAGVVLFAKKKMANEQ